MEKLLDLLSGNEKFKSILLAWVVPVLLFELGFVLIAGPDLRGSWLSVEVRAASQELDLNLGLAALLIGIFIATTSYLIRDDIYRVLEGYNWPRSLRDWRIARAHLPEARYLRVLSSYLAERANIDEATEWEGSEGQVYWNGQLESAWTERRSRGRTGSHSGLLRRGRPLFVPRDRGTETAGPQDLPPYVVDDAYVAATNLGNRMAVVESYGLEIFGLDSQVFWYDLVASASSAALSSIDEARDKLDALIWSSVLGYVFALGCLGATVWGDTHNRAVLQLVVAAVIGALVGNISYRLGLRAAGDYGDAFHTIVKTGRLLLARQHNLQIPDDPTLERRMWEVLAGVISYPNNSEFARELMAFKVGDVAAPPQALPQPPDEYTAQ